MMIKVVVYGFPAVPDAFASLLVRGVKKWKRDNFAREAGQLGQGLGPGPSSTSNLLLGCRFPGDRASLQCLASCPKFKDIFDEFNMVLKRSMTTARPRIRGELLRGHRHAWRRQERCVIRIASESH